MREQIEKFKAEIEAGIEQQKSVNAALIAGLKDGESQLMAKMGALKACEELLARIAQGVKS